MQGRSLRHFCVLVVSECAARHDRGTTGADVCPIYPGKRYVDWPVADPAGRLLAEVRAIRDDIDHRVRALLHELVADEA